MAGAPLASRCWTARVACHSTFRKVPSCPQPWTPSATSVPNSWPLHPQPTYSYGAILASWPAPLHSHSPVLTSCDGHFKCHCLALLLSSVTPTVPTILRPCLPLALWSLTRWLPPLPGLPHPAYALTALFCGSGSSYFPVDPFPGESSSCLLCPCPPERLEEST